MRELIAILVLLAACNPADPGANEPAAAFYASPTWTAQVNPNATAVLLGYVDGSPAVLLNTSDDDQPDGTTALRVDSSAGTPIAEGDVGAAFSSDALYTFAFDGATVPETVDQYGQDVAAFMMWMAEPGLDGRKEAGFRVIVFLILFAIIMWLVKRRIWSNVEH